MPADGRQRPNGPPHNAAMNSESILEGISEVCW
jgi:hypothetical protein